MVGALNDKKFRTRILINGCFRVFLRSSASLFLGIRVKLRYPGVDKIFTGEMVIMNSREIVKQTLIFEAPERLAISFEPTDFSGGGPELPNPDGEWRQVSSGAWERKDEWGNTWRRLDPTSKGEVAEGALQDLRDVDALPLPDFSQEAYYSQTRHLFQDSPDHYHIGGIHGYTFSVARKLRRMEQYLMDLVSEPQAIRLLHDRVDEQIRLQMLRLSEAGADCIMLAEDWGTQLDLLISPRLWRQEFKPRFQALNDYAHSLGLKVFMHSCGKMTAIIPDLIETGVDLLQFDQPRVHGIEQLQAFQEAALLEGRRLTYWCPVDIQKTLQTRDEVAIRSEASELVRRLWLGERKRPAGGFIAGFYSDEASLGLEPKWQQIACDAFVQAAAR